MCTSGFRGPPTGGLFTKAAQPMAWLVLVLGLAFTLWGWRDAALRLQEQADASFDGYAARVSNRIGERFEQYLDFLLTFQSLFHSSEHVTREEFRRHFDALQSRSRYRAVLAVQYSQLVEEREREAFERRVDGELHGLLPAGVHYRIYPAGGRALYLPVIYNEPMRGNEVAMGFDSLASPLHKRTVEMARDEGLSLIHI